MSIKWIHSLKDITCQKFPQEAMENLNGSISIRKFESIMKKLPTKLYAYMISLVDLLKHLRKN